MESLNQRIDKNILHRAIIDGEELTRDYIMNKREKILKKHINSVYPIKEIQKGDSTLYYTKLEPNNRNHSHKVSAKSLDALYDKIIAYYLEIEIRDKTTVYDILDMALLDLNPLTASRHRQTFNKYFAGFKDKKISALCEKDIRECLQAMLSEGIKAKAFNNATSTLNKINDYCVYNHINCINIRDKVSEFRKCKMVGKKVFIKGCKKEQELAFSESEAVKIIRYSLDNADYLNLAIAALITTGLRSGELLALKVSDIDLDRGIMYVDRMEQTKTYDILDHCKDNSERTVFLNSDAKMIFKKVLSMRVIEDTICEFLFLNPNSDDEKLHLRAMDNRLRKIQHILHMTDSVPERSPHDCRRTYASIQYLHGIDIKTIQAQLGHASAQQTWDYIRDIVDSNTRAQKLEQGCILDDNDQEIA